VEKEKIKVLVLLPVKPNSWNPDGYEEADIVIEDGSIASIYHNGEHIITNLYQSRIDLDSNDYFENLANNSKIYLKDWDKYQNINNEIVEDAVTWLVFGTDLTDFEFEYKHYDDVSENVDHLIHDFLIKSKNYERSK